MAAAVIWRRAEQGLGLQLGPGLQPQLQRRLGLQQWLALFGLLRKTWRCGRRTPAARLK
jgi:hypothetical protein